MNNSPPDRRRRPRFDYQFHKCRNGDAFKVTTPEARVRFLSAFFNWKKTRPGTLKATSKKTDGGYLITFSGISPAEATAAQIEAKGDI